MDVIDAIRKRRSIRQFRPEPVPRNVIEKILEDSRWAPSGSNTQPWEMLIVGGHVLDDFKRRIAESIKAQGSISPRGNPDIPFPVWPEPYKSRANNSLSNLANRQISRASIQTPLSQSGPAFLYGAQVAIIIYTERSICPKAILDIGLLSQTLALSALGKGLGTCMMTYGVSHPEIIREMFGIAESKLIALCIAIGYPDVEAEVNNFERNREPVEAFTHWYGI